METNHGTAIQQTLAAVTAQYPDLDVSILDDHGAYGIQVLHDDTDDSLVTYVGTLNIQPDSDTISFDASHSHVIVYTNSPAGTTTHGPVVIPGPITPGRAIRALQALGSL